jgi:hypothetical protein
MTFMRPFSLDAWKKSVHSQSYGCISETAFAESTVPSLGPADAQWTTDSRIKA